MPNGGRLTIGTAPARIDDGFIASHGYGEPGSYACISVSDTGTGMDDMTRARIFEPFFTTKEVGKGTGLGLSIVYGVVKQHNGYITVDSEREKGTTVRIYLPLVSPAAVPARPDPPATVSGSGRETILLAEDDQAIRDLTKALLERHGYTVIEACDGQEAVDKFKLHQERIHLLLTDVIMPKRDGRQVYEEARNIRPGIKSLFISGYPSDIIRTKGVLEEGINFVSKPFSPKDLVRKVREVLDA
jgi:CheY-like chemotaxis protein